MKKLFIPLILLLVLILCSCNYVLPKKMSQEDVRHEYSAVIREIQQGGVGSGAFNYSGYALTDLDGDGNLELLLIDNSLSDYYKQYSAICSVYAIRNGQLACIEKNSSKLQLDTLLTADGTFYQSVGDKDSGYVSLSKFHLEARKSTFTVISKANASLSFANGNVPVPHWTKKENGKEASITENEFDALYKHYNNPGKLMALNIVPLHSDMADEDNNSQSSETSSTLRIKYPQTYQSAPSEYKPILDDLYYLSESIRKVGLLDGREMGKTGFAEYPYPRNEKLGYAVVDINSDGIPKLLLGTKEGLVSSQPNSVFTLKKGKPVLLTSFWSRNRGIITSDGTIWIGSSFVQSPK